MGGMLKLCLSMPMTQDMFGLPETCLPGLAVDRSFWSTATMEPHTDPRLFKRRKRSGSVDRARFLTCACFQGRAFLRSERACQWLAEAFMLAKEKHSFDLRAYVFMPTHFHTLLVPRDESSSISDILKTIKQSVGRRAVLWTRKNAPDKLHVMADVHGERTIYRFWQRGGGYDRVITSEDAYWSTIEYIHLNPVEEGLCASRLDWPWSSARAWAGSSDVPIPIDLPR